MTHVNDDDADDGIFDDTLCEILGASSRVETSLDLDLAFGAVDINVDLACTSLLSPPSPLPSPLLLLLLLLGSPSEIQEFSLSNLKNTPLLRVSWVTGLVRRGVQASPVGWGGGTDPTPLYGSLIFFFPYWWLSSDKLFSLSLSLSLSVGYEIYKLWSGTACQQRTISMHATTCKLLPPPASSEPEAGCSTELPPVRLPRLAKTSSFRLLRSASVELFSPTNVADAQAAMRGPPKKTTYRKRSVVPCQGPTRGSGSPTLDSSLSQSKTFSRTSSVNSTMSPQSVKASGKAVLNFRRTVTKAAKMKNFTKSLMSSVDSLRDQIRSTYESCEKARKILSHSDINQTTVLLPFFVVDDQSLVELHRTKAEFHRRIFPGVRVRRSSLSKSSPMMRRGNTRQLVIKSILLCQSPSPTTRRALCCPQTQAPKFFGDDSDDWDSTSSETEATSTLDGSLSDDQQSLLEFDTPIIRYLPGVGRRLVRTNKQCTVALVVPNGSSADLEQPDQHLSVSIHRTCSAP